MVLLRNNDVFFRGMKVSRTYFKTGNAFQFPLVFGVKTTWNSYYLIFYFWQSLLAIMIGAQTPRKNVPDTEFGPRNRFRSVFQKLPSEMKEN